VALFSHGANDAHEGVHYLQDRSSGLRAIIAIHVTIGGNAAGGCRVWRYVTEEEALADALRLSRGMTYKNAMAGLAVGGAKAVILLPPGEVDRSRLFESFGKGVDSLGGQYITAEDVGSTTADMQIVRRLTPYVAGLPRRSDAKAGGDPSPWTALGTFLALQKAVESETGKSIRGLRFAVQGVGSVGSHLCRYLHECGAQLILADISSERLRHARERFGAQVDTVDRIHAANADVFVPCAMGAVLSRKTIPEIKARIVCGAANNQLADAADGERLRERGILYCPDYVVNAGGIISVMAEYQGQGVELVDRQVREIPKRLSVILDRARAQHQAPNAVADAMARQLIGRI
jgi:leucine dehydrogenase